MTRPHDDEDDGRARTPHDVTGEAPGRRHEPAPTCSARGCREPATWELLWNNPRLHTPERRKSWLACAEHRESLAAFLTARSFLREVRPFAG